MLQQLQYSQYLQFHLFGVFNEAQDRTKEENEQWRGFYFRFDYMAGSMNFQVDRKTFTNAPAPGTALWIDGILRTSSSQRINAQIVEFKPTDQVVPIEEQQLGGIVIGPAGITRTSFVVDGEPRYRCRISSFGFFRDIQVSEELYRSLPSAPNQIFNLHGRLTPDRDWNKEYGFRTTFNLALERLDPYEGTRPRRRPEGKASE